jgi:hypothetical protein
MDILILLFGIIFTLLMFFGFIIFPIILLLQCLFDSTVQGTTKLLVVVASFISFPLPSFCYGAFVRNGAFSKFMVGLYALMLGILLVFFVFFGGWAIVTTFFAADGDGWSAKIERIFIRDGDEAVIVEEEDNSSPPTTPAPIHQNTYEVDDVNVFKSGKAKKEDPWAGNR